MIDAKIQIESRRWSLFNDSRPSLWVQSICPLMPMVNIGVSWIWITQIANLFSLQVVLPCHLPNFPELLSPRGRPAATSTALYLSRLLLLLSAAFPGSLISLHFFFFPLFPSSWSFHFLLGKSSCWRWDEHHLSRFWKSVVVTRRMLEPWLVHILWL